MMPDAATTPPRVTLLPRRFAMRLMAPLYDAHDADGASRCLIGR